MGVTITTTPDETSTGKRFVQGVGINDMPRGWLSASDNNMKIYRRWAHMLARCYDKKTQKRNPTYAGCTVCFKWLTLSNFAMWVEKANSDLGHSDWQLDKDLLIVGEKQYSPATCLPVTPHLNLYLTDSSAIRGELPQGVKHAPAGKYRAMIRVGGKYTHIGTYDSPEAASDAYVNSKRNNFRRLFKTEFEHLARHGYLGSACPTKMMKVIADEHWPRRVP